MAAVSAEPSTAAVLEWLKTSEEIVISDWLITEAVAALSRKRRRQILSADEHTKALSGLHRHIGGTFRSLPVARHDFRTAASFAERPETRLRAGDALHLSLAAAADAMLVTLDKGQARAGGMLQVKTLLL